jgi:hypothetical protein
MAVAVVVVVTVVVVVAVAAVDAAVASGQERGNLAKILTANVVFLTQNLKKKFFFLKTETFCVFWQETRQLRQSSHELKFKTSRNGYEKMRNKLLRLAEFNIWGSSVQCEVPYSQHFIFFAT